MIAEYVFYHFALYDKDTRRELLASPPPPPRPPEDTESTFLHDPAHGSYFNGYDRELQDAIARMKTLNDLHLQNPRYHEKLLCTEPKRHLQNVQTSLSALLCFASTFHKAAAEWFGYPYSDEDMDWPRRQTAPAAAKRRPTRTKR